jgi:hypothetical protein
MNRTSVNISGQWLGYFQYGPEYGDLYGEKVTFSFVLENLNNDQFYGKCYELEGVGVNPQVSIINGYIEDDFINFVKEYPEHFGIEQDGSFVKQKFNSKPILTYTGQYNHRTQSYQGTWEIEINLGPTIHGDLLDLCTGTWEMSRP